MAADRPGGGPAEGDPYADEPDRWAEADRAWEAKWSDDPAGRDPEAEGPEADDPEAVRPPSAAYRPRRATLGGTTDAYGDGMRAAGPHLGLGLQIGASMVFFVGLGIAVDRWLGTTPWGVVVGAALGMVGVLMLVVRVAKEGAGGGR